MTEIIHGHEDEVKNLVIPTDKIPPAAWQAIYYHLSKKTETNRKLYSGTYEIDKNKIIDLVDRLDQAVVGYGPQAKKIEFSITFRNDTSEQLSSLEKFRAIDVSHKGSSTKGIAIDYDFLLCPSTEISMAGSPPQKFKVFMLIDQDFFLDPDPEQAGFFPDGVAGKNILAVIEYSDYAVSRALRSSIDEWVSTLGRRDVGPILKLLPRVIRSFRGSFPFFGGALAVVPFLRFYSEGQLIDFPKIAFLCCFCVLISMATMKIFVSWSMDAIAKVQPATFLLITAGDKQRKINLERKSQQRLAFFGVIFTVVVLGFIIGTTSSLFANFILSY